MKDWLLGLMLVSMGALVVLALIPGNGHDDRHCAQWQPVATGKATTLICTRWEDRR